MGSGKFASIQKRMLFRLCAVIFLRFTLSKGEWVEKKGLWYYISQDELHVSYQQATSKCESMNARLAVITNQDQNNFLTSQTDDGAPRWIGLSNNKHKYTNEGCQRKSLVWNYDWDCEIKFQKFESGQRITESGQCIGVVSTDGIWNLRSCTDEYGFICQWECKNLYMQLNSLEKYTGIYTLSYYYEENIVYKKQGTHEVIEIWKFQDTDWKVTIKQHSKYTFDAYYTSSLYVPYGNATDWKTQERKSISANFFCIECNKLSVCVNAESNDELCYSQLTLKFDDYSTPEYVNAASDVIITHHYNSYYCICVQSNCSHRCGYIFPYPQRTTITTLNDKRKVAFTNLCLPGDATISDKSGKTVTSVTVSLVVLVIIIVAIVVACIVLRRRRCTDSGSHGAYTNDNMSNTDRSLSEVGINDNMYVDLHNEPCVDNQSSETSNEGQYSYAGMAIPTNINISKSSIDNQSSETSNEGQYSHADMAIPTNITPKVNISTKMIMVKVSYGVQNDDVPKPVDDNKEGIDELYAKVNKPTISSANLMEGSGKTVTQSKQLITVKADTETEEVQHTDDDSKLSDDNPATHNNGDDDLELFENSVYESTQG